MILKIFILILLSIELLFSYFLKFIGLIIKKIKTFFIFLKLNLFLFVLDYFLIFYSIEDKSAVTTHSNFISVMSIARKSLLLMYHLQKLNLSKIKKKKKITKVKKRIKKPRFRFFLSNYIYFDEFDGLQHGEYYKKYRIKYNNSPLTRLQKQKKIYYYLLKQNYNNLENPDDLYEIFTKCFSTMTARTPRERLYRYKYFKNRRKNALKLRNSNYDGKYSWYSHPCWWWWLDDEDDEMFYFLLNDFLVDEDDEVLDYLPEPWDDWVDFFEEYKIEDVSNDFISDWWGPFFLDSDVYRVWNLLYDNDEDIWDETDIYIFFVKRAFDELISNENTVATWIPIIERFLSFKMYYSLRLEYWLMYMGWHLFYLPYYPLLFKEKFYTRFRKYKFPSFQPQNRIEIFFKFICQNVWFFFLWYSTQKVKLKKTSLLYIKMQKIFYLFICPFVKKGFYNFKTFFFPSKPKLETTIENFWEKLLTIFDLVILCFFVGICIYIYFYKLENDPFILYLIEVFGIIYAIFYYIGLKFGPRFIVFKYFAIIILIYFSQYIPWAIIEPYFKTFYDFCQIFLFANFERLDFYLDDTRLGNLISETLISDQTFTGHLDEPSPAFYNYYIFIGIFLLRMFGFLNWFVTCYTRTYKTIEGYAVNFSETKKKTLYNSNGFYLFIMHIVNICWNIISGFVMEDSACIINLDQFLTSDYFLLKHLIEYITTELWTVMQSVFIEPHLQFAERTKTNFEYLTKVQFPAYQPLYTHTHTALNSALPVIIRSFWFAVFLIFLILIILIATYLLSPKTLNFSKFAPYECGFDPYGDARSPFDINFYFVAILFLIFDLEVVLLYLWVFSIVDNSLFFYGNFFSFLYFLILLGIGFIYEWFSGGLDWASFIRKRLQMY